jgi:hypothetical protein
MKPFFLYASLCLMPAALYGQSKMPSVSIKVYPNPATDKVTYTFPAGIQKHLLQVTDMGGRTIFTQVVGDIGTQNTINVSNWKPGLYFVSVNCSSFSKTVQLVKQ